MNGEKQVAMGEGQGAPHSAATMAHNDIKLAGEESKERMYESKHHKKLVRVVTVLAYVLSVSLAAIMLSMYYVFLWDPRSTRNIASRTSVQPTRCPTLVDYNAALPPGVDAPYHPADRPLPTAPSENNYLDDENGPLEPPRALPRAPPKNSTAALTSEPPPVIAAPDPPGNSTPPAE